MERKIITEEHSFSPDEELQRMGIRFSRMETIREKAGVGVYRIWGKDGPCVLKAFQHPEDRREIENYRLLNSLGVPTLRVLAATERALVLEDVAASREYRLGVPEDHGSCNTAARLAEWYQRLHRQGRGIFQGGGDAPGEGAAVPAGENGGDGLPHPPAASPCRSGSVGCLYDENALLTGPALAAVAQATGTQAAPFWPALEARFENLTGLLEKTERTLTYNDFYYTNLAVARDGSAALMFDYNLLGKGYAYADLRNVTASLEGTARDAFWEAYGPFDPAEQKLDAVVSVLVSLILCCRRGALPAWAAPLAMQITDGTLLRKLEDCL